MSPELGFLPAGTTTCWRGLRSTISWPFFHFTKWVFCPHYAEARNLKTQQSPVILDLCLRKTRSGKSRDYRDAIVLEKLRFQNVFRPHENEKPAFSNSQDLKSVFEKLRFRDGLMWTEGCVFKFLQRRVDRALGNFRLFFLLFNF